MRFPSYDRWLLVGGPVIGAASAVPLVVPWLVPSSSKLPFWSWPRYVFLAMVVIGTTMLVIGFFMRDGRQADPDPSNQPVPDGPTSAQPERIGYRVSGHAQAKTRNAHISGQRVAFDLSDDAHLDDEGTIID